MIASAPDLAAHITADASIGFVGHIGDDAERRVILTIEPGRVFGGIFTDSDLEELESRVAAGQPLNRHDGRHHILRSLQQEFLALIRSAHEDPAASIPALHATVESEASRSYFYARAPAELARAVFAEFPLGLHLEKASSSYRARESGRKVGGARKDLATLRMGPPGRQEELVRLLRSGGGVAITKDDVLPERVPEDLRAQGAAPAVAFAMLRLRRCLPRNAPETSVEREIFVLDLRRHFDRLTQCRSVHEARQYLGSALLPQRRVRAQRRALGTKFFRAAIGYGHRRALWDEARVIESAAPEEAWELCAEQLRGRGPSVRRGASSDLPTRTQRRLQDIVRIGPPLERGTPDGLVNRFGLTGVEFGGWVNSEEGALQIDLVSGSFADLFDVLGANWFPLIRRHGLALALGARGSGRASAHYEPRKRIINLTKTHGDGSLAPMPVT